MKNFYSKPQTEVKEFETVDVITTSGDPVVPPTTEPTDDNDREFGA